MLIKNGIDYERVKCDDMDDNPIVAIKIKTKKYESTMVICHYRQCKLPGEDNSNSKEGISKHKKRLEYFKENIGKITHNSNNTL